VVGGLVIDQRETTDVAIEMEMGIETDSIEQCPLRTVLYCWRSHRKRELAVFIMFPGEITENGNLVQLLMDHHSW
jgi:hypothetical protein